MKKLALVFLTLCLAGCLTRPVPGPGPEPDDATGLEAAAARFPKALAEGYADVADQFDAAAYSSWEAARDEWLKQNDATRKALWAEMLADEIDKATGDSEKYDAALMRKALDEYSRGLRRAAK